MKTQVADCTLTSIKVLPTEEFDQWGTENSREPETHPFVGQ